jgi:hypothetical protein
LHTLARHDGYDRFNRVIGRRDGEDLVRRREAGSLVAERKSDSTGAEVNRKRPHGGKYIETAACGFARLEVHLCEAASGGAGGFRSS